jgi:hypothetical protein
MQEDEIDISRRRKLGEELQEALSYVAKGQRPDGSPLRLALACSEALEFSYKHQIKGRNYICRDNNY